MIVLSMADSHPVNMICIPQCNPNITASEKFVNEWLNRTSDTGIHQLRRTGTIISMLMENTCTHVGYYECIDEKSIYVCIYYKLCLATL